MDYLTWGISDHYLFLGNCPPTPSLSQHFNLREKCVNVGLVAFLVIQEARPGGGRGGGSHVARLNFKTSLVSVFKCLALIVGFAITVAIWSREVVSCCDFILRAVTTFWAMSLVGIYPGRASFKGIELIRFPKEPPVSN